MNTIEDVKVIKAILAGIETGGMIKRDDNGERIVQTWDGTIVRSIDDAIRIVRKEIERAGW